MSEETQVVTETASEETTQTITNESPDNSALIAESKKYRNRAQEAEAELAKLKAQNEKAKEAKMIAEGKKDELIAKYQSENEALVADSEKWAQYEEAKRLQLIEQHPEDDRDALAGLPLDTLEYVTNKVNNVKANAPEVVGNARQAPPIKPFNQMTDDEKRASWNDIVRQASLVKK